MEGLLKRMLTKDPIDRVDWKEVFQYEISEEGSIRTPGQILHQQHMRSQTQNMGSSGYNSNSGHNTTAMKTSTTGSSGSSSSQQMAEKMRLSCKVPFSREQQKSFKTSNSNGGENSFSSNSPDALINKKDFGFRRMESPRILMTPGY